MSFRALTSIVLLLALSLTWGARPLLADQPIPTLSARVTDLTSTLSAQQRSTLEAKLASIESRKGAQVAILLVPTTEPETIEQYSLRVVESWKIGRKRVDDGVLILLAMQDRAIRIEVGYGLEGAITDALASRIIREVMTPALREGNPFAALNDAVGTLERVLSGEPLPPPAHVGGSSGGSDGDLYGPFFFIAFVVGSALRGLLGRPAGAVATLLATTAIGALLGYLIFGAITGVLAALFVAFGSEGRRGGFSSAGWSSRSGGFGGGGFSGGGGSFGGGGASGRW